MLSKVEDVTSSDSSLDSLGEDFPCLCQYCPAESLADDGSQCCKYTSQCKKSSEVAGVACVTMLPKFQKMMDEACIKISWELRVGRLSIFRIF